ISPIVKRTEKTFGVSGSANGLSPTVQAQPGQNSDAIGTSYNNQGLAEHVDGEVIADVGNLRDMSYADPVLPKYLLDLQVKYRARRRGCRRQTFVILDALACPRENRLDNRVDFLVVVRSIDGL